MEVSMRSFTFLVLFLVALNSNAAIISPSLSGDIMSNGVALPAFHFAGILDNGDNVNIWYQFDLSTVTSPITSATLSFSLETLGPSPASHLLSISDVSVSLSQLMLPTPGIATFLDLQDDESYGTYLAADGDHTIPLSAGLLESMRNSTGSLVIGISNVSARGGPIVEFFDYGAYITPVSLQISTNPVPEPSIVLLFLMGIILLVAFVERVSYQNKE
jgi:hypothetical protein